MKLLIVTLCVLAVLIPDALSLECYVCENKDGNCETGKTTCKSGQDRCGKAVQGSKITKDCATTAACILAEAFCKNKENKCESYCCDSNLCNGGVPLMSVSFLTLVTMALGVAKYLM